MTDQSAPSGAEIQREIPKELAEKVASLRALALVHRLLGDGHYPANAHAAVASSQEFIQALHAQLLTVAVADPDSDLSPDLVEFKKRKE